MVGATLVSTTLISSLGCKCTERVAKWHGFMEGIEGQKATNVKMVNTCLVDIIFDVPLM